MFTVYWYILILTLIYPQYATADYIRYINCCEGGSADGKQNLLSAVPKVKCAAQGYFS